MPNHAPKKLKLLNLRPLQNFPALKPNAPIKPLITHLNPKMAYFMAQRDFTSFLSEKWGCQRKLFKPKIKRDWV